MGRLRLIPPYPRLESWRRQDLAEAETLARPQSGARQVEGELEPRAQSSPRWRGPLSRQGPVLDWPRGLGLQQAPTAKV